MLLTFFSLVALSSQVVRAQVLVNGQIFTNGLAIIDSPAPSSTLHAGSTTGIAIDVSGDGKLTSSDATRFDTLEVYLTSPSLNLTVSQGPELLTQEQGSTVKHINWSIDACVPSGNYNLTFYETAHIQDKPYFTITPLPISIQNTNASPSACSSANSVQTVPQPSSALTKSPWLDESQTSLAPVPFPSSAASFAVPQAVVSGVWEVVVLGLGAAYLTCWV